MRSAPASSTARSRSFARRTATGPIPVCTWRSGPWPCRTMRSPLRRHSTGFAGGTSYGGFDVKRSFLISWRDWIRGSSPSSLMRQLPPHHLVSGRTSGGPDHNPSCLRVRARRNGTLLGSAASFSPGSGRSPFTPDPAAQFKVEPRIGLRIFGVSRQSAWAGFSTAPVGTRPWVTNRHSATSSLRASAVMAMRLMRPRPSRTRSRYQALSALSG